jgi:glutathione synthase/RimK-type ligase-like ATP-grasp enzyme
MAKLVFTTDVPRSRSINALRNSLSTALGYRVLKVRPDRVRRRVPLHFRQGMCKIQQLRRFIEAGVPTLGFSEAAGDAVRWIEEGHTVVCRTLTRASEGRGIVLATTVEELQQSPLYTQYFPKKHEYRVQVFNGKVIDIQEKRKKRGFEGERESKVRNLANGYVFCRDNVNPPEGMADAALTAVNCLGYTFGAVDVAYNVKRNEFKVLEVNALPGMEGTTLVKYTNAVLEWKNGN